MPSRKDDEIDLDRSAPRAPSLKGGVGRRTKLTLFRTSSKEKDFLTSLARESGETVTGMMRRLLRRERRHRDVKRSQWANRMKKVLDFNQREAFGYLLARIEGWSGKPWYEWLIEEGLTADEVESFKKWAFDLFDLKRIQADMKQQKKDFRKEPEDDPFGDELSEMKTPEEE